MKEREVKRYLEYLGQEPAAKKVKAKTACKKQTKGSAFGIIRALWSSIIPT